MQPQRHALTRDWQERMQLLQTITSIGSLPQLEAKHGQIHSMYAFLMAFFHRETVHSNPGMVKQLLGEMPLIQQLGKAVSVVLQQLVLCEGNHFQQLSAPTLDSISMLCQVLARGLIALPDVMGSASTQQVSSLLQDTGLLKTLGDACSAYAASMQQQQHGACSSTTAAAVTAHTETLSPGLLELWRVISMDWPGSRLFDSGLAPTFVPAVQLAAAILGTFPVPATLIRGPASNTTGSFLHNQTGNQCFKCNALIGVTGLLCAAVHIDIMKGNRNVTDPVAITDPVVQQLLASPDLQNLLIFWLGIVARAVHRQLQGRSQVRVPSHQLDVPAYHSQLLDALGCTEVLLVADKSLDVMLRNMPWQQQALVMAVTRHVILRWKDCTAAPYSSTSSTSTSRPSSTSTSSSSSSSVIPAALLQPLLLTVLELQVLLPELHIMHDGLQLAFELQANMPAAAAAALVQPALQLLGPAFVHVMEQNKGAATAAAAGMVQAQEEACYHEAAALYMQMLGLLLVDDTSAALVTSTAAKQPLVCTAVLEAALRATAATLKAPACAATVDQLRLLMSHTGRMFVDGPSADMPALAAAAVADPLRLTPQLFSLLASCYKVIGSIRGELRPLTVAEMGQNLAFAALTMGEIVAARKLGAAAAPAVRSSSSGGGASSSSSQQQQQVVDRRVVGPWLVLVGRGLQAIGWGLTAAAAQQGTSGNAAVFASMPTIIRQAAPPALLMLPVLCRKFLSWIGRQLTELGLCGEAGAAADALQGLLQQQAALSAQLAGGGLHMSLLALLSGAAVPPQLTAWAQQLQEFGAAVAANLPVRCCNNPTCTGLTGVSEVRSVTGPGCTCSACKVAKYCGRGCQKEHWPQHKAVCQRMKAAAKEPAAAGHGKTNAGAPAGKKV